MQLIARLYRPQVAVLPIGDHYTMGPEEAAVALELLGDPALRAVPLGNVPAPHRHARRARRLDESAGRPNRARGHGRAVRERWFGATGRRVPEIALESGFELDEALVLDAIEPDALRAAHELGRPVVIRASTAEEVRAALARPEVACALVTDPALLELDLTELTYG